MDKIKEFVKKYKKHIGGAVVVLLILVWAFWYGGNAPGARGSSWKRPKRDSQLKL